RPLCSRAAHQASRRDLQHPPLADRSAATRVGNRSSDRSMTPDGTGNTELVGEESGLHGWDRFIGRGGTEGSHPILPGEAIRGTSTFEWLDGESFLIWRSRSDHPEIPNATSIIGVTDGQLSMHYFDSRGVYRVYGVSLDQAVWQYRRDASPPDPSQRVTRTFTDDRHTHSGRD